MEEKSKYKMCLLKKNGRIWERKFPERLASVGKLVELIGVGYATIVAVYPMEEKEASF